MCNGDFGMYRVMPWAYPTIPGQSSGGSSVDPIPVPQEECYDFSNCRAEIANRTVTTTISDDGYSYVNIVFALTNVKLLDITNVSSVVVKTSANNITVNPNVISGSTAEIIYSTSTRGSSNLNINANHPAFMVKWPGVSVREVISIFGEINFTVEVYNANGDKIQSYKGVTTS